MNIFSNILRFSIFYKLYQLFYTFIVYISEYNKISKIFYGDDFKALLKKYLNIDIKTDWIGRNYGIINPMIDINGHFDINNSIIEINGDLTNNTDQIQYFIHKQLNLIGELFKINKLYDYIYLSIEHVGSMQFDNYLVVFDIISRKNFAAAFKKFAIQFTIYFIIAIIMYIVLI